MGDIKDKPRRVDSGLTIDHGDAGQVESDAGGNRVWRWAKDVLDSTSILLKKLENQDLALEPTQKVPVVGGAKGAKGGAKAQPPAKKRVELSVETGPGERDKVGGFDPYNSR